MKTLPALCCVAAVGATLGCGAYLPDVGGV